MGTVYKAVLAVGKEFNEKSEGLDFILSHMSLSDQEVEDWENDFWEMLDAFGGECLNCYSGDYGFVGFTVSVRDPEAFQKSFDSAMDEWNKHFPSVAPDIIHTVKVY